MGYKDRIEKYKEHQIEDEEFWEMVAANFETYLDIKKYGKRFLLEKKVKEIKAKHAANHKNKLKAEKIEKKEARASKRNSALVF